MAMPAASFYDVFNAVVAGAFESISYRPAQSNIKVKRYSATGTRTRVARVKAEYPNQLDYSGVGVGNKTCSVVVSIRLWFLLPVPWPCLCYRFAAPSLGHASAIALLPRPLTMPLLSLWCPALGHACGLRLRRLKCGCRPRF